MPGTFSYAAATNTVTVTGGTSGSPADFASFVAADRGGAGTLLLAAWSPNSNTKALTYQVRPVELLALLITFTVAGKTAETDYILITGTDAWGNAQTEPINVSAGNGTYITTKHFRTITNIDCSDNAAGGGAVWANGTVAVTQPIWGVIWDKSSNQYQLDCKFNVGDGSINTYFTDTGKQITIKNGVVTGLNQAVISVKAGAVAYLCTVNDVATKATSDGCQFILLENTYYGARIVEAIGTAYVGSASCRAVSAARYGALYEAGGTLYIWNCLLSNSMLIRCVNGSLNNIIHSNPCQALYNTTAPVINLIVNPLLAGQATIYASTTNQVVVNGLICNNLTGGYDVQVASFTANVFAVNCIINGGVHTWSILYQGTCTGSIYRQNTLDLHLTDVAGNNIAGAAVTLTDIAGPTTVFSVTTGADGKITFPGQDSSTVDKAVTHTRYYYSGGAQSSYRGPWTLTITKTGYQTYQDVIAIDRKMDLEIALLALAGGVSNTNLGLVPLGIKQVAI
jgi:hypothetical protein